MHSSKLLRTLRILREDELQHLQLFLSSPYFLRGKQQREVLKLWTYLRPFYPQFTQQQLDREAVFTHCFPTEAYQRDRLDKLISVFLQKVYQFIHLHCTNQDTQQQEKLLNLSRFFRERNAYDLYEPILKKLKKAQQTQPEIKADYHRQFRGQQEHWQSRILEGKLIEATALNEMNRFLDIYYVLNRLEDVCFLLSENTFRRPIAVDSAVRFLEDIRVIYERYGLLEEPVIALYYLAFDMLKSIEATDDDAYWQLKQMLAERGEVLPLASLQDLHGLSRNFIIYRYNRGDKHLESELFALYQSHLAAGYLDFQGGLLPSTVKNIVTMGLRVNARAWVRQFLEDYKNRISGTRFPQDVYHFNLATFHFKNQAYDEALNLLADHYEDWFYKLAARRLELKIYYETDSELLDAKMDAFKLYVFRLPKSAILPYKRTRNNNFINLLRQLRNPKTRYQAARIEKLRQKINATKHLSDKDWLLEQLELMG